MVQKKMLNRIRDSRYLDIMIDESMDTSITCHLVVIVSFAEEGFSFCIFLGLWYIKEEKKDACIIFKILTKNMKE